MPLGGGKFSDFNKKINGVYSRFITQGQPYIESIKGVVAGGIVSDWAPDDKIFVIEKDQFDSDPVSITGYTYNDPKNQVLREVFAHAIRLYTYKLNKNGEKAKSEVGEAKNSGSVGNGITVSVLQNVVDETKYDVTTYLNGVEKDKQTVAEKDNTIIEKYGFVKTKEELDAIPDLSSNFGNDNLTKNFFYFRVGDSLVNGEEYAVIFEVDSKKYALPLWNLSSGHKNYYLTLGDNLSGSFINDSGDWKANSATVDVTGKSVKVSLFNYGKKVDLEALKGEPVEKIIDSVSINCTNTTAKEAVKSSKQGADGSLLEDNDFVVFKKGILEPNAGYVFSGGSSGSTVTGEDHTAFLNKLEGRAFNNLFYDGNDETIKGIYDEYTRRLRDSRGIYFQTVLSNYADADYEGIISVYNDLLNADQVKTPTPWLAGLLSSLDYSQEATNTIYDGTQTINANISQSRMEVLADSGHFFFHETDIDEVSTYEDVNTFRSFTDDKNDEVSQNKVIRIVDYIHNSLARVSNRLDIGKLNNTETGRNVLWARVDAVLTELVDSGAIAAYEPEDIRVLPIPNQKNAVQINLNITVNGTIRKIYITTYIVK